MVTPGVRKGIVSLYHDRVKPVRETHQDKSSQELRDIVAAYEGRNVLVRVLERLATSDSAVSYDVAKEILKARS